MKHLKIDTQVRNILRVYDQATDQEIASAIDWYRDANDFAHSIVNNTGLPLAVVCGVIAALSPAVSWEVNKKDAHNFFESRRLGNKHLKIRFSTYGANVRKADKILSLFVDGTDKLIDSVLSILNAPKTSSFFLNILNPDDVVPVTIDRHAYKIAMISRKQAHTGGSVRITPKQCEETAEAYRKAAQTLDLIPSELQAIVWVTYKRLRGV